MIYEHADDTVPYGVLTGDTLFIGDVGRPDLLASIGFTREELADKLYDSLHDKLMTLPDATRVYPAHGAGSACGKNLSTDLWSTMGEQRKTNYALRAPDKATFMDLVTEGQPPAPGYFVYDAILNRKDRELLDETKMPTAMTYEQVSDGDRKAARCWSTVAPRRSSRWVTCGARSTSVWKAATPSSPGRWCNPTSTSCSSPSPVWSWRARTVWPGSVSTASSATSTSPTR